MLGWRCAFQFALARPHGGKGVANADGKLADGGGFLLIINGFVEILGRRPGFIRYENNCP
jgi:hypothetical protein